MTPDLSHPALSLFEVLDQAADKWGDREFMVVGSRRDTCTFAALRERAAVFGLALRERGVLPGDRVAIACSNSVEWVVAAYGTARIGGVVVGLSTRSVRREMLHYLQLSQPKVWIIDSEVRNRDVLEEWLTPVLAGQGEAGLQTVIVRQLGRHGIVPMANGVGTTVMEWAEFIATSPGSPCPPTHTLIAQQARSEHKELEGAAAILFTSGTTALPKGVVLGHEALCRLALEVGRVQGLGPDDRFYSVAPFFHCSGYMHAILTCLIAGCRLYTAGEYKPEEALSVIKGEKITVAHGSSLPLEDIADRGDVDPKDLGSFTRSWGGGTRTRLAEVEHRTNVRLCKLYGLTETGGNAAIASADETEEERLGADGTPLPGIEIRIVGQEDGLPADTGCPGEIQVRGWNLMNGYFRDPMATAAVFTEDGWFRTGDLGLLRADGRLKWLSRIKDIIRVSGENLASSEIEDVLLRVSGVHEVAVVAKQDDRHGEVPVAFVLGTPGQELRVEALEAECKRSLAKFKIPVRFFIVDDFPRTDATKRIQKAILRERLESGEWSMA